jgi:hypothetical protein
LNRQQTNRAGYGELESAAIPARDEVVEIESG